MNADDLLSRLERVRPSGSGEWTALCPHHDDRSPSLTVKDCGDGRLLVHCFAGCSPGDVLSAIGLTFSDVMPERVDLGHSVKRMPWNPRTVLAAVAHDALCLGIIANDIAYRKIEVTPELCDDIWRRTAAIHEAVDYATR